MQITKHAKLRSQQRGIKDDFLQVIMQEGNTKKLPAGATAYSLRKKDKNRIILKHKKIIQNLDKVIGVTVVKGVDNLVLTAYHKN